MTKKCKSCENELIFEGGFKRGRVDLEIYQCSKCGKYYSFDVIKKILKEYKVEC